MSRKPEEQGSEEAWRGLGHEERLYLSAVCQRHAGGGCVGAWKASRPGSGGPGGLGCEQAGKARKPGASEGEDAWHGKRPAV